MRYTIDIDLEDCDLVRQDLMKVLRDMAAEFRNLDSPGGIAMFSIDPEVERESIITMVRALVRVLDWYSTRSQMDEVYAIGRTVYPNLGD